MSELELEGSIERMVSARWNEAERGELVQILGSRRIDQAVVEVFPEATRPCAVEAARRANEEARSSGEALRVYWAHQIEKAQYEAQRAERQYTIY